MFILLPILFGKDINSALRSHRKPAKPEFYQLIVVNFNRIISHWQLIENRLIVNIPKIYDIDSGNSSCKHNEMLI